MARSHALVDATRSAPGTTSVIVAIKPLAVFLTGAPSEPRIPLCLTVLPSLPTRPSSIFLRCYCPHQHQHHQHHGTRRLEYHSRSDGGRSSITSAGGACCCSVSGRSLAGALIGVALIEARRRNICGSTRPRHPRAGLAWGRCPQQSPAREDRGPRDAESRASFQDPRTRTRERGVARTARGSRARA